MNTRFCLSGAVMALAMASASSAYSQTAGVDELLAMSKSSLRSEMERRYNEALTLTQDQTIVSANSVRYMWASQAKAQCGIAIGYLKSGHKDPVSVGKCVDAHLRMQYVPPPPAPVVPEPLCEQPIPGLILFDWNVDTPPAETDAMLNRVVYNMPSCGWTVVEVVGHADRSGGDSYNEALAERRARNVAAQLVAKGIPESQVSVISMGERMNRKPTEDGVRERENRGVEVTVK